MKREYSTFLFDFDYTLADSSKGILLCYRTVLNANGFTNITDYQIKRTIGKTLEDSFEEMTGIHDRNRLLELKAQYVKQGDLHMTANTVFFPEAIEVLTSLKEKGAKIGIISTKYRYRIEETFTKYGVRSLLDLIVGGEDVSQHKPSPEGLLYAIDTLKTSRKDTLYLGDSLIDAETAQRAEVDFCGVLNGATTREELATYPHVDIVDNLKGIL